MKRSSSSPVDVAVIGAARSDCRRVAAAAARAARDRARTREPGLGTSRHAAGMLAPIAEVDAGRGAAAGAGLAQRRPVPDFVAELERCTGSRSGYLAAGRCWSRATPTRPSRSNASWRSGRARSPRSPSAPGAGPPLEPALAPSLRLALDVPDDHAIDPRGWSRRWWRRSRAAGGELRPGTPVASRRRRRRRACGRRARRRLPLAAEQVVVAAGPWSGRDRRPARSALVPVRPVKGQIMRLHDPAGPGLLTRVMRMGPAATSSRAATAAT